MKKATTLLAGIFLMCFSANAIPKLSENTMITHNYGQRYIFVEGGVEFSIFPDGQFDFVYLGQNRENNFSIEIGSPNVNISFNSGYDYDMYVQYDNYGAVIQVENVPIYYDRYGRISQAGNVNIYYNDRHIARIGDLYVHYDRYGHYSHFTGFINSWNKHYIARPWHRFFVRPSYSHCIVYDYAYRRYYEPIRYSYSHHRKYYKRRGRTKHYNGRRDFYNPGSRVHYKNGRTAINEDYQPRERQRTVERTERGNRNTTRENSRDNARNKNDKASETRRTVLGNDTSRRSNTRTISRSGDNEKQSVRRVTTQRKNKVAPKQREKVSRNKNRSEQRSTSVKRKTSSKQKAVKRGTPSRSKSTSGGGGRSSRGGRG